MTEYSQGSVIAGRYRIDRLLGRGGMGSVWAARHLQLDAPVAVKVMDPSYASSADARRRFEREARASAKLDSPHVVRVQDYGIDAGSQFLVMELLQGEDLSARLTRERLLSLLDTTAIVTQVCKALRCAHEARLVHRDLKPGNIFLARQQDDAVVKVLDFGIAKAMTPELETTRTGVLLGSPHYMSPEQARNSKAVDLRSDLWSLGVIIFLCLTGQLPFPGEELAEVLFAICSGPIPAASRLRPGLGPELDRFFEQALARDPARRFQSARELAQAFTGLVGGSTGPVYLPPASARRSSRDAQLGVAGRSGDRPPSGTLAPTGNTVSRATGFRRTSLVALAAATPLVLVAAGVALHRLRPTGLAPTPAASAGFVPDQTVLTSPEPIAAGAVPSSTPLDPTLDGSVVDGGLRAPEPTTGVSVPGAATVTPPVKGPPPRPGSNTRKGKDRIGL